MYELDWIKELLRQIRRFLQSEKSWLGIDENKKQRILDYACGNGTVSSVRIVM